MYSNAQKNSGQGRAAPILFRVVLAAACCVGANLAVAHGDDPVLGDDSKTSRALQALPPKPLEQRIPVTIYEFRSSVSEISAAMATDMFTTALLKSHQFRVVERQRMAQGIVQEKQLNGANQATGDSAQKQLRGARYVFEGTISGANAGEDTHQTGLNTNNVSVVGGTNKDTIAIDVRIVDANTGDVLDAVDVHKALNSSSTNVNATRAVAGALGSYGGFGGGLLGAAASRSASYQGSHKDGVSDALRSCIEAAVLELVKRVELTPDSAASQ